MNFCSKSGRSLFAAIFLMCSTNVAAQDNQQQNTTCTGDTENLAAETLWDGPPPGMSDWGGTLDIPVEESSTPNGNNLFNVIDPTIEAFLPHPDCATGAAVLVVPGGGFRLVAINHEGRAVGQWLAEQGIAAFVLKYRTVQYAEPSLAQPVRRQLPMDVMTQAAMEDAHRAMELIRSRTDQYGIDANRIGSLGFSAGGHIVSMLSLDRDEAKRPAFTGVMYGALFNEEFPELPPANLPIGPDEPEEPWLRDPPTPAPGRLPPIFLAIAQDDRAVSLGFRTFYDELYAAGYRPETHLYARGGHGFGMNPQGLTTDRWINQFHDWMGVQNMLHAEAMETVDDQ